MTCGRFAPSPTGPLHLGLARTALLAWLGARAEGGRFVLRVEDLDSPRVVPGAADRQLATLRWLGLDWDEGPDVGGPHGPYLQSARSALYAGALERLTEAGRVYPCTCSRKEIALASAPHGPGEFGVPYPGTCRDGASHADRPASLRFRVPEPLPGFVDRLHGPVHDAGARGDFVLRRADGLFSYHLAVVLDDIAMGVDQVVRGADLLGCTGWQLALYEALQSPAPSYAHVPLMLDRQGRRLSKRDASLAVDALRAEGATPERVVGALAASLGLAARGRALAPRELLEQFAWDRLGTRDTRVDPDDFR